MYHKSGPFSWASADTKKSLKALGWSSLATVMSGLIVLAQDPGLIDVVPKWLIPLVPAVNTLIVAIYTYIKENRNNG